MLRGALTAKCDLDRSFFPRTAKQIILVTAICANTIILLDSTAIAASDIGSGSTYLASNLGSSVNPDFKGGTLEIDSSTTITQDFTVENDSTNTIDAYGNTTTLSGAFTGAGPLTFTDSIGGGNVTLTNSGNTYSGVTTINAGATLTLSGSGTISASSSLADNGTFDISPTTSGASLISLSGSGAVTLGAQTLTLSDGADTFSGTISGTGALVLTTGTENLSGPNTYTGGTTITAGTLEIGDGSTSGTIVGNVADAGTIEFNRTDTPTFDGTISGTGAVTQAGGGGITLTAANSYTGITTISAGTLALSGNGSIATSSSVATTGTFDISATAAGASIKSLTGTGTVQLGAQTLTLTSASGTFSGVIAGTGGFTLNGGTELLSGANTYTGPTTVNAGTLEIGAGTIGYNITDSGTFAFDSASTIAMSGVASGSGTVAQIGAGLTTITTPQTYTGPTTISSGTLALSGGGSIAFSSSVTTGGSLTTSGTLDISAVTGGTSIISLSGTAGSVKLGTQTLTLTNAVGTFGGVISGTGGFTLAGGNEMLSGTNTYTGVTTIASGTLFLSGSNSLVTSSRVVDNATLDISAATSTSETPIVSIVSLSGSGAVALGANILALTDAGDTFSGTISGAGGLTVSGGTETLAGANSYTGTTTISAGSLVLSSTGSLATTSTVADNGNFDISATSNAFVTLASLSGSGTVNLGANNLNLINASMTFSGAILGTGELIISGGTETLAGANSYAGGTTIGAGTLQIGHGLAAGSITGNVVDNGTLAFDRSDSTTFSGVISGSGAVSQIGSGTTALTAANTYTGGTTITAGTLQIGDGGTTGSIAGDVVDNGTLAFDHSDPVTFGATISGTGAVTQIGTGTLALTAVNSYIGTTAISSGAVLTLGSSGSIAASGSVIDNGTFDVSATTIMPQITSLSGSGAMTLGTQSLTLTNASGTFSGVISGTGGLLLDGGTETLSGANTYAGATTINGGTLAVNGSIIGSSGVTVNSGGTLAGTGTVPTVTINSGGTLAPGVAGVGTLNVNGTVAFASGSKFIVNVSSASAGKLSISGAETIAGTLAVASTDGTYPLGQKLTVLTANGGVTGSFTLAQIENSGAEFSSALSYDADNVYLEIDLDKLSPLLPSGATTNEVNAVGGVDAAIAAGDSLPPQFENLGNISSTSLATDANQLTGGLGGDIPEVSTTLFDPFLDAIFDHIGDGQPKGSIMGRNSPQETDEIWASGFKGASIISGDPDTVGSQKFKSNVAGFIGGADWRLSPHFILGAAVSAGFTNFHLVDDSGTGKANALQAGLYGFVQFSPHFYGSFAGGFALDGITTDRVLTVSGTDDLTGKLTAVVYGARYETGVSLSWAAPYIALQDELSTLPAYSETASSGASTFALSYAPHTLNTGDFEMGLRQGGDIIRTRNWTLRLFDRLAWAHNLSGGPDADASFAALPSSSFTVYGAKAARDSALVSLGAELKNGGGFDLDVHLDSAISSNSQTYTGIAGLGYAW